MIKHIVMLNFKDEADGRSGAENMARIKAMVEALPESIEQIREIEVSIDIVKAVPECSLALYSVFETEADLQAYQVHPEHKKVVELIQKACSGRSVVDYRI